MEIVVLRPNCLNIVVSAECAILATTILPTCSHLRTGQAFFIPCSVQGNFHGELVFKTIGPLVVAAVIGSVQVLLRSSFIATNPAWRGRSMRCNEFLLALTYFVLTPATNAALRTLSCEVCMHVP